MKTLFAALAFVSLSASAAYFDLSKILDLNLDQPSYLAGGTANFHGQLLGKPDNPDFEFDVLMTFNDAAIPVTKVNEFNFFATQANLPLGENTVSATVYIQDKNFANELKTSIQSFQEKIDAAQNELEEETDPERIGELNAEIAKYTQLKNASIAQLESLRTKVRGPINRTVPVN